MTVLHRQSGYFAALLEKTKGEKVNAADNTRTIRKLEGHSHNGLSHVGRRTYPAGVRDQNRRQVAVQRRGNRAALIEPARSSSRQPIGKAPLMQGLPVAEHLRTALLILALICFDIVADLIWAAMYL